MGKEDYILYKSNKFILIFRIDTNSRPKEPAVNTDFLSLFVPKTNDFYLSVLSDHGSF